MAIEFRTPEEIEKQLRQVSVVAENVMRPESRQLDDAEHVRPVNFVHMIWPQMKEMERVNLEASLRRSRPEQNGHNGQTAHSGSGEKKSGEKRQSIANLSLIHMIEMLSWGDAGVYLCIPASALAGAAIQAVGTPDQKERFLRRFTEGEPKWGAMAMTEPQAGSDTSNIQTTATFDAETNRVGAQRAKDLLHQRQTGSRRIRRADCGVGHGGQAGWARRHEALCGGSRYAGAEDSQNRREAGHPRQ